MSPPSRHASDSAAHLTALRGAIAWAEKLLADKEARRKLCAEEFVADDVDDSGAVSLAEAKLLIAKLCSRCELDLPREAKVEELLSLCDKSGDGELQLGEFQNSSGHLESACKKAPRISLRRRPTRPRTDAPVLPADAGR